MDEFLRYRKEIRKLAIGKTESLPGVSDLVGECLSAKGTEVSSKAAAKRYREALSPLLKLSDEVRENFHNMGITLKVSL